MAEPLSIVFFRMSEITSPFQHSRASIVFRWPVDGEAFSDRSTSTTAASASAAHSKDGPRALVYHEIFIFPAVIGYAAGAAILASTDISIGTLFL